MARSSPGSSPLVPPFTQRARVRRARIERFGNPPYDIGSDVVWFHTVSAGETIAAVPLIESIAREFHDEHVLVTTTTPAGSGEVQARLGGTVGHCYAPYDFTFAVRRFFDRVRPKLLVLMETELWPNLIHEAAQRGVPVLSVNARMSERSAKGYKKLGGLTRSMLDELDFIACQTERHRQAFLSLGAREDRVAALGSVKFDVDLPADAQGAARTLRDKLGLSDRTVWIAASTHPGEDEIVLGSFETLRQTFPGLALVLVPRHPVRAGDVAGMAQERGFSVTFQSSCSSVETADVLIGDVMGTLLQLYGAADIAFVGGSFVPVGGHNPIEPALWRVPILSGPLQFNFPDVMEALEQAGGLRTVADERALTDALMQLLESPEERTAMGDRALEVVVANRGATDRVLDLVRGEVAPGRVLLGIDLACRAIAWTCLNRPDRAMTRSFARDCSHP